MIILSRVKNYLPEKGRGIRLGIYQGECEVGSPEAVKSNLARLEKIVSEAKEHQVQLISFPELYLTGYALGPQLTKELAEPVNGPSMTRVAEIAKDNNMGIICPYPELDNASGKNAYYDSIAVFSPDGELLHNYRKVHLFGEAEKLNFSSGGDCGDADKIFKVINVFGFPVGILNCYEAEFPELSRILALRGAKLIVIPTAADYYYTLPNGKKTEIPYPDISKKLLPAHSFENHIHIAYSNRCGHETVGEQSWEYRGNSIICAPNGNVLLAPEPEETLIIGDIVPEDFGRTHPEGNYLKDREPALYHDLIKV